MTAAQRLIFATSALLLGTAASVHADDAPPTSAISHEPFYAGIVSHAQGLLRKATPSPRRPIPAPARISPPSRLRHRPVGRRPEGPLRPALPWHRQRPEMHLMGVSRDLPLKLDAVRTAKPGADLTATFTALSQDISDNIERHRHARNGRIRPRLRHRVRQRRLILGRLITSHP
ncbi:MAG: hypothetical protein WDN06_05055 [Asticcacaulis sp.]